MYEIETTEEFDAWLGGISDSKTQKVIIKRIRIMSLGTLGKVRSLGSGLFEAKIDYGSGFRLYFINKGKKLLCCSAVATSPPKAGILNKPENWRRKYSHRFAVSFDLHRRSRGLKEE
jgi:putative addiction module killer protein